jgi:hypothetical protein
VPVEEKKMRAPTVALLLACLLGAGAGAAAAPEPSPPSRYGTMTVEAVEPGVVRVLDDGAGHDLTDLDTFEDPKPVSLIAVGDAGSVWLTSRGGFIELGSPVEVPDPLDTFLAQMSVGPDGTLAIADGDHGSAIGRWHAGRWSIDVLPPTAWVVWLDARPGGGLDYAWRDGSTLRFDALSGSAEDDLAVSSPPPLELSSTDGQVDVARTPDGRLWVAEGPWWQDEARFETGPLWMLEGSSWQRVEPLTVDVPTQPRELAVDGSGALWAAWVQVVPGTSRLGPEGALTRVDAEGTWTVFDSTDVTVGGLLLAGEASVWFTPGWCEGYARFDGVETRRYLDGLCVRSAGRSAAGEIWLFGFRRGRVDPGVYVISTSARCGSGAVASARGWQKSGRVTGASPRPLQPCARR